jgi:hypothetical protein
MIKMELRCPDFWFKVGNINLEELPRMATSFDESIYIEDFGSDDEEGWEDFYFKCRNKEDYYCRFERFLLNNIKGRQDVARWAEQILYSFVRNTLPDFVKANNINKDLLNEDNIEILNAVDSERRRKIRENAFMELMDEDSSEKVIGYYDFETRRLTKI